ncbi:MAG: hypothetical protein EXR79_03390 [Myxococcales bacterium]|nr:hypothetical protein [Myxococcales bacterium]
MTAREPDDDDFDDDDSDGDDPNDAAGGARASATDEDDRWEPRIGPAHDPFEDRPDRRRAALRPLLGGDDAPGLGVATPRMLQGSGWERLDLLLGLSDPHAAVQALAPEEFALLAKDIGLADATDLLALASPRQLQACVDLDGWDSDGLDLPACCDWLLAAHEAGPEVAERFVAAQEDGVLGLLLLGTIRVMKTSELEDTDLPDDMDVLASPDGTYQVLVEPDSEYLPAIQILLDALFRATPRRGRNLLEAQRWELPAQLEEDLRELRATRLDDMGAAEAAAARDLYGYVDAHALRQRLRTALRGTGPALDGGLQPYLPDSVPPRLGLMLRGTHEPPLLQAAILALPDAERSRVRVAVQRLAWRVQSARAAKPSAVDELPRWTQHAVRTAAMGLEFLSDGDGAYAALLLCQVSLRDLFSAGHGLVLIERARARRLRDLLGGADGLALLDAGDAALLRAMVHGWPGRPASDDDRILDGGVPAGDGGSAPDAAGHAGDPLGSLAEVAEVRARLQGLAAVAQWMQRLAGGDLLAKAREVAPTCIDATGVRLHNLFATALVRVVLRGRGGFEPLQAAELRTWLRTAVVGEAPRREVRPEIRQALLATVLGRPDLSDDDAAALATFVTVALDRVTEELGGLDAEQDIDLRLVGNALLLRR